MNPTSKARSRLLTDLHKCLSKQLPRQTCQKRQLSALVTSDPFLHYQSLVNVDYLRPDESQLRAAKELQKLYRRIDGYRPPIDFDRKIKQVERLLENQAKEPRQRTILGNAKDKSLVRQLSWEEELLNVDSPRGLLLSGQVGTGKSMLVDILLPFVKRWHHNALMLELFARLNRARDDEYIILKIAYELIEESPVLAIDEFQLGPDPASARVLKGVLIYFWKMGGVLVATSNRMPEDIYSGTFQAEQFKSFTELLSTRCVVHDMRSGRDFRKEVSDQLAYYHAPGLEPRSLEEATMELMVGGTGSETVITVYSRKVKIPDQVNGVAKFSFAYLCESDLGPADYISIASMYHTIILDQVPILTLNKKNEARRLITLIDALYEAKCKLLVRAEAIPDELFFPESKLGGLASDSIAQEAFSETFYDVTNPNRPNVSSYADPRLSRDASTAQDERTPMIPFRQDFGKLNAFTGQDEQFAFKRAASRLHEMTSRHWWDRCEHTPTPGDVRMWERSVPERAAEAKMKEEIVFRHGASPFRVHQQPPPKFGFEHFWSMVFSTCH